MPESQKKVLEMLAAKKINVDEAHRLLSVLGAERSAPESTTAAETAKPKSKYLRVTVEPGPDADPDESERVNIRVPLSLIRSGIKLATLIPPKARDKVSEALHEKGLDFDIRNLKPEHFDELIEALSGLEVNVDGPEEVVKVFVE